MKRNVLFVTDMQADTGEGLSYALELAKMIDKGISVLMIQPKRLSKRFDDLMTAITFAEAGEHETARQYAGFTEREGSPRQEVEDTCRRSGVDPSIFVSSMDAEPAIEDYLKHNAGVEMVILSPNITMSDGFTSRTLKRLVKAAPAPIVTLTRAAHSV